MQNSKRYLNLACGDHFIISTNWINTDWAPKSRYIKQVDLLKRLPFPSYTFDLAYCSHFLEHISRGQVKSFLDECYRVLKIGGVLRLVLPDFESIAREYIRNIDEGNFILSEFNITEMIDQCVRTESGGELKKWYQIANNAELEDYIYKRTGYFSRKLISPPKNQVSRIRNLTIKKLVIISQIVLIKLITSILPSWYRRYHILNTSTGEVHRWVYDFNSLAKVLSEVGFKNISKLDSHSSQVEGFSTSLLDLDERGLPRKGLQSMYIEATR